MKHMILKNPRAVTRCEALSCYVSARNIVVVTLQISAPRRCLRDNSWWWRAVDRTADVPLPPQRSKRTSYPTHLYLRRDRPNSSRWYYLISHTFQITRLDKVVLSIIDYRIKSLVHQYASESSCPLSPRHDKSSGCKWRPYLQMRKVVNKQSKRADKGWSLSMGVGRLTNNSSQ